ncbi:IQ domain-containing protein E isoform X2 [Anabas testudineus]|uniref:IQ domain-containing protein E isoform X2 n=1 Tax=Anabas testudineus TaxID=64144 RepID=UPI000E45AA8E|nr:IQ domain-containing protein E isoform X2 [Anabas testudineus]
MFTAAAKTSLEASDIQTDEDCEELGEDAFSFAADIFEKEKTRRKQSSGKPPASPRSPYLSSLNVNSRKAAVAAWRLPRASLGDTREDTPGDITSARLTSLSNGHHDLSQMLRSECDMTPELLKQTSSVRKHKHLHSTSNGFTFNTGDCRGKEDMYDEIIRLKKTLQAQKSDNQKMKAKLRRLEEDNTKREKQIEELLDPTKGSEYTRSLVDKKKEGSVVVSGLKQRILKLEQQCREKENALSKLQSELRTTNLEELKITVETYFEEIQRLRILLEVSEKGRAESKCSQRQQKALSSTVDRLSENLKQLQKENTALREELNTDSPAGGIKGYRDWSKQRLLRKLLEVEKRLGDSRRHALTASNSGRLDQAMPTEIQGFTMATEAVVSVGTMTEEEEEVLDFRGRLSRVEKEKVELQEKLSSKDDELTQLRREKEELEKETERWKTEQTKEWDKERQQHKHELEQLWLRIQTVEEDQIKPAQAELFSLSAATADQLEDTQVRSGQEGGEEKGIGSRQKEGNKDRKLGKDVEKRKNEKSQNYKREKAANIIQTNWKEHRNRDIVMLQSALRGHLLRESQLKDLLKDTHHKGVGATNRSDVASSGEGEVDVVALTMIQSTFRGHIARCSLAVASPESSVPSPMENSLPTMAPRRARSKHTPNQTGSASLHNNEKKQGDEEPWHVSSTHENRIKSSTDQTSLHNAPEFGAAAAVDSDDSDDIIVSPSRPLRSREALLL